MAISVLDVRDTVALPRVPPRSGVRAVSTAAPRRPPLAVLAAGAIGITEALGLLAVGLTGLDGLLTDATRPAGGLVAAGLIALAGWVVAVAGCGATLIDGAGRRGHVAVAYVELFAVAIAGVAAVVLPLPTPEHLPLPALVLLLPAVPVAKLLLAGSAPAIAWVAAGPPIRERRPDPVARHRGAAALTVAAIGLALGALAVGGPRPDLPGAPGTTITSVVADR